MEEARTEWEDGETATIPVGWEKCAVCDKLHIVGFEGDCEEDESERPPLVPFDETAWIWEAEDEAEELKALKALQDEAESQSDWTYGATLIKDSYFETYAQDLAEDIGAIHLECYLAKRSY